MQHSSKILLLYQNLLTETMKKSICHFQFFNSLDSYPFQIHPPSYSLGKQAEVATQKAAFQLNLFEVVGFPCSHLLECQWYFFQVPGNLSSIEKKRPQKEITLQHTFFSCFFQKQDEHILFLVCPVP